jgi:hypothetical protein
MASDEWVGNARYISVRCGANEYEARVVQTHREGALVYLTVEIDPSAVDYERFMRSVSVEALQAALPAVGETKGDTDE